MAPLVFLMGVGPIARWKQSELPDLATRLRWALAVAVVAALLAAWAAGRIGAGFGSWFARSLFGISVFSLNVGVSLGCLGRFRGFGGFRAGLAGLGLDSIGHFLDDGSDSSKWRRPIENWFATIAMAVFAAAPFVHAITGEEVSGVEPSEQTRGRVGVFRAVIPRSLDRSRLKRCGPFVEASNVLGARVFRMRHALWPM